MLKLKPIPRLILIAAIIAAGYFGATKLMKPGINDDRTLTIPAKPVQPEALPVASEMTPSAPVSVGAEKEVSSSSRGTEATSTDAPASDSAIRKLSSMKRL